MNDQSRRAADFDRRMRWSWMRKDLTDGGTASTVVAEEVVDLRPIEERAEPPRED